MRFEHQIAAQKREEREARKRARELERQAKQNAKLSELEQARLAVEVFESQLQVLLSIHKERGKQWDWLAVSAMIVPAPPPQLRMNEALARLAATFEPGQHADEWIEDGKRKDGRDYAESLEAYQNEVRQIQTLRTLAKRVLDGEHKAYAEVLSGYSGLGELSELGSQLHFTVHSSRVVECRLRVRGQDIIPADLKSLTSSGKLTSKPMPKNRFHEIYQDYVCGCVLRVARELFAALPVDRGIVSAFVLTTNTGTGHEEEQAVLSVAVTREEISRLRFESVDPSEAIEQFTHRGDARASKRTGEFEIVQPLTPEDLDGGIQELGLTQAVTKIREWRLKINPALKITSE